jgi:hypothetical protein
MPRTYVKVENREGLGLPVLFFSAPVPLAVLIFTFFAMKKER